MSGYINCDGDQLCCVGVYGVDDRIRLRGLDGRQRLLGMSGRCVLCAVYCISG